MSARRSRRASPIYQPRSTPRVSAACRASRSPKPSWNGAGARRAAPATSPSTTPSCRSARPTASSASSGKSTPPSASGSSSPPSDGAFLNPRGRAGNLGFQRRVGREGQEFLERVREGHAGEQGDRLGEAAGVVYLGRQGGAQGG